VGFNDKAIVEAKKYFGYFALVSNQAMDTFTALENYRLKKNPEKPNHLSSLKRNWKKTGLHSDLSPRSWTGSTVLKPQRQTVLGVLGSGDLIVYAL